MAVKKKRRRLRLSDCQAVEIEEGTIGGSTNWVKHEDWEGEERALCLRPIHAPNRKYDDEVCAYKAGWGTEHLGEGACKLHGGQMRNRAIKNGKQAHQTKRLLKMRIDEYIDRDNEDLFDLTYELASMRVLMREMIDRYPAEDHQNYEREATVYSQRIMAMVQAIGSLVDKISRIESRNTITAAQIVYLRARIADILVTHIPDVEKRERAIQDLAQAIPGGTQDAKLVKNSLPGA